MISLWPYGFHHSPFPGTPIRAAEPAFLAMPGLPCAHPTQRQAIAVAIIRFLTPPATFLHGRGEEIPLAESSAEVVFCTISLHHWADQAAGLREVARVLRPGGLFCLADGVIPSFAADLIPHTRVHTRDELQRLFWHAGFSVIAQKRMLGGAVLATVGRKR